MQVLYHNCENNKVLYLKKTVPNFCTFSIAIEVLQTVFNQHKLG